MDDIVATTITLASSHFQCLDATRCAVSFSTFENYCFKLSLQLQFKWNSQEPDQTGPQHHYVEQYVVDDKLGLLLGWQ